MTTLPQISGTRFLIDRLEKKAQTYRRALQRIEIPDKPFEQVAITKAEVNTLENLILQLSREIAGISEPQQEIWERSHPYCSRNEQASSEPGDIEYFRWFLIWLQQCRAFLDFLEGYTSATGGPRKADEQTVGATSSVNQPYDVALSFAGPDRKHAKKLADLIRENGFRVFYDEYEQHRLWGVDLYAHLSDVYKNRAKYCVMFLSIHYAERLWTNHERKAAQARSFRESLEYILPLRLDDTEIPGIHDTVGYLDLRHMAMDDVFQMLKTKLMTSSSP
ncbi:MAG: TIR domain-containing protein [Planctomycetes bacterium]|nr:TIR domain-containing protein [Planctomycetota bacterium]